MEFFKKTFTTKNVSGMAVFSALSFALYFLEIPIFPATPFLKLDFSNVLVMLGGFMYGPFGGVIILLIKEALHIFIGSTLGLGEMVNFIVGLSYILLPSILYLYKKGLKNVIISLVFAVLIEITVSLLLNKFVNFPLYDYLFNIYDSGITFEKTFIYIILFNLIKYVSISFLTIILYKKLSSLFIKINLKSKPINKYSGLISKSEKDTFNIAYNYAKTLNKGDVILLEGELGAGKTAFTKGVCKYFNIEGVVSPTYSYLNVYGDLIYHYDCYRLSSGEDALRLGLTDYFNKDNIAIIEWAENIKDVLPENVKKVKIEKIGKNKRRIIL